MQKMDVSIIIANYNTKALTKQCLQSVFEKTKEIAFEVIVVDNASQDGSQQMLKEEFPNVQLVENMENLGFGKANNKGIKIAQGRNLFLLNSDTILRNNAVKVLSDYLDGNPGIGVCGGNIFDQNGKPAYSFMPVFPSILWELDILFDNWLFRLIWGKKFWFNKTGQPKDVAHITGANMMTRKAVFEEAGGFDPDFFMYMEETELMFRMKKMGHRIVSVPQSEIIHLEGKSFTVSLDRQKRLLEGRNLFYKKTHGNFYRFTVNSIYRFKAIFQLALYAFSAPQKRGKVHLWMYKLKNIQ